MKTKRLETDVLIIGGGTAGWSVSGSPVSIPSSTI